MSGINLIELILRASIFGQLVLLVLLLLLYFSLWYILRKRVVLRSYEKESDYFEQTFWSGGDIAVLEKRARSGEFGQRGLAKLFLFGQDEFKKICESGGDQVDMILESVQRALTSAIQREEDYLNRHMSFLATVASVSPYIGLLGTVWGIISAFHLLAQTSQATIAAVAPGIAEALVATAMGLLAAITASIAYNYYDHRLEQQSIRFETFVNRYLNVLHRNL